MIAKGSRLFFLLFIQIIFLRSFVDASPARRTPTMRAIVGSAYLHTMRELCYSIPRVHGIFSAGSGDKREIKQKLSKCVSRYLGYTVPVPVRPVQNGS